MVKTKKEKADIIDELFAQPNLTQTGSGAFVEGEVRFGKPHFGHETCMWIGGVEVPRMLSREVRRDGYAGTVRITVERLDNGD